MKNNVRAGFVRAGFVGAGLKPAPTVGRCNHGIPEFVRALKTFSARRINERRRAPGIPVWQRNYYEHVVRNDLELDRIRVYIAENPMKWDFDRENPFAKPRTAGVSEEATPWNV